MKSMCLVGLLRAELFIEDGDLASLLLQPLFVEPTGDLQTFGVIGDGDEFVASLNGGSGHFRDRAAAVAPLGVHLQVTVQPCPPLWIFRENFARLRQRQEFAAHRRTFERWRCIEPTVQTFGERGTDAG